MREIKKGKRNLKMKKVLISFVFVLFGSLFLFSMDVQAENTLEQLVVYDGFENMTDFSNNEKFYSEYGFITTDSEDVISGNQSLKLQTTFPQGTYTPTILNTELDTIDISGPNSYTVSMKIKVFSFQALMIEVRKDWDTNTKASMPYEFGLYIDENANTVSRRAGWIPLNELNTFNESYSMDENGVISLSFTFSSDENAVIEIKGQTGTEDYGYMIIDDFQLVKEPRMVETFENRSGDFWNSTAFWANVGNLTSDVNEAINGTSLKYEFTDNDPQFNVSIGGITDSQFTTVQGLDHTIEFSVKGLTGANNLTMTALGGGDYKEVNINLLDGSFTGNFTNASVEKMSDYYRVTLPFTATASENYAFNFYGGGELGVQTGLVVDDFVISVAEDTILATPMVSSTYDMALQNELSYQVVIDNLVEVKNHLDETMTDYTFDQGVLTLSLAYLNTLSEGDYFVTLVSPTLEKELHFNVVDSHPEITSSYNTDYEQNLQQDLILTLDLKGYDFESISLDGTNLTTNDYELDENTMTLYGSYLKTLSLGDQIFTIATEIADVSFTLNMIEGRLPVENSTQSVDKGDINDVSFVLNVPTESILSVTLGETVLSNDSYTIDSNLLVMKSSYLDTLAIGTHDFTLNTSSGDFTFSIEISVSSPTIEGDASKSYDKNNGGDVSFTVDTKGLSITNIQVNETALSSENYTFTDGTLTIFSTYLSSKSEGDLTITLETLGGEIDLTINITDTTSTTTTEDITTTTNVEGTTTEGNGYLYFIIPGAILAIGLVTLLYKKRFK